MKKVILLISILFIFSCSNDKLVYWCGDHECVNKKEKEAYFKKNMIIEVKEVGDKKKNKYSKDEEIIKQVKKEQKKLASEEKKLAKEMKLEEKRKIKDKKELEKAAKLEEKRRLKEEKKRLKEEKKLTKLMKKTIKKDSKKSVVSEEKITENTSSNNTKTQNVVFSDIFHEIKERVVQKNLTKPYPDINDIPK